LALAVIFQFNPITEALYILLLFCCLYAVIVNFEVLRLMWKNALPKAGSAIAHIGLAFIILGALFSGSKRNVISENKASFSLKQLNQDFQNHENVLLRQGDTILMKDYFVSYRGRYKDGHNVSYHVSYYDAQLDEQSNKLVVGDSLFTLTPIVQLNEQFGNVSEPGTKHFLTHDVFTHVKYADMDLAHLPDGFNGDGFMGESELKMVQGSRAQIENYEFQLHNIALVDDPAQKQGEGYKGGDIVVKATLECRNTEGPQDKRLILEPVFLVRDSVHVITPEVYSEGLDAKIRIKALSDEENTIILGIRQREFIVMQASVFPAMNLLWAGCILMVLGCLVAWRSSISKRKIARSVSEVAHA
jgi:cytochrome c-type biogenesis protein CcmF